jgi:shikimate kinase
MPLRTSRGVALGGFMGSGKTTVGALLAGRIGLPFVDMDAVLVERHGAIARQFQDDGEAVFRARESALLAELCDGMLRVVATGGGVWASAEHRALLRRHHWTVVLRAPLDELARRIGEGKGRPLWASAAALLEARRDAYADADLVVDTEAIEVDGVVDRIEAWLGEVA